MRLDDVRLAHIADAEHQAQDTVPLADYRVSAEQQRLRAFLRPGQLGKHHAHHERLDHDAHDALQAHDEYRLGTLLRGVFGTVTCRRSVAGVASSRFKKAAAAAAREIPTYRHHPRTTHEIPRFPRALSLPDYSLTRGQPDRFCRKIFMGRSFRRRDGTRCAISAGETRPISSLTATKIMAFFYKSIMWRERDKKILKNHPYYKKIRFGKKSARCRARTPADAHILEILVRLFFYHPGDRR